MPHQKRTLVLLALAAGVLASASVAMAQARMEITPFAGYYIASDLYNAYSSSGSGHSNVELTNSFMWGGRLTSSSPRGGIELAYTRTGSEVKVDKVLAGQPRTKIGRIDIDNYDINFLGYEPTGNPRVTPFALIGFGWAVTHPKLDKDVVAFNPESNTLFNFNFGLGFKSQINEKTALRIEGRWRVTDTSLTTSSGLWCDPWGYCYSYATQWYNSGELIAGLSIALK
jgi:opacity protein-like surface antigen